MKDHLNYLKTNLNLNGFNVLKTSHNKILIFKSYSKYSKCIYLNFIDDCIEINIDKVFDVKGLNIGIERLVISRNEFENIYESIDFIQKSIAI